jgi:hypothetical protein
MSVTRKDCDWWNPTMAKWYFEKGILELFWCQICSIGWVGGWCR